MNCQIKSVTATAKDGRVSQLEYIYLRGSKIRFMVRLNSLFKYLLFYYVYLRAVIRDQSIVLYT